MANLYELTQAAVQLQEMLETGEIDETTYADTLEAMGVTEKAENICKMIRNLDAKATAYKEEKDRLAKRQSECENGIKRLKNSLLMHLNTLDRPKINAGLFTVYKGKTKSVKITDQEWLHESYLEPQPPTINRKKIADDLRQGFDVAGAEFEESEYVVIR